MSRQRKSPGTRRRDHAGKIVLEDRSINFSDGEGSYE